MVLDSKATAENALKQFRLHISDYKLQAFKPFLYVHFDYFGCNLLKKIYKCDIWLNVFTAWALHGTKQSAPNNIPIIMQALMMNLIK